MNTDKKRKLGACFLAMMLCVSTSARAEVKCLTLGIDTTCSMGLSECWWLTLEGLILLEGVESIKDPPDNKACTGEIKTKGGRLIDLEALAKHLAGLRNGSHLRGVEAVVDGFLEQRGGQKILRASGTGEILTLTALTGKIHRDPKTEKIAAMTRAEKSAYKDLCDESVDSQRLIRVTGPLRKVEGQKELALEVRLFDLSPVLEPKGGFSAEVVSVTLGVDVKPYGLSEVWSEFREEFNNFPGVASISKEPDLKTETFEISLREGRLPNATEISEFIQRIGVGAKLRGMEATVDGWMTSRDGKPVVQLAGIDRPVSLAPLSSKIQFDLRKEKTHSISSEERRAYKDLMSKWDGKPRQVRIVGPLIPGESQTLKLEVRQFEVRAASETNRLTTRY